MSREIKPKVTVFNEGHVRTNGNNPKPVSLKPDVKPSGQQTNKPTPISKETKKN